MKPFIKLFKSKYGHYFYDVNTDRLIHISEISYKDLCEIEELSIDSENDEKINRIISGNTELAELTRNGFLKSKYPVQIQMPETHNIPYYLRHKLHTLTLQVTQQCNFRCRYCHYTYGDDIQYHSHKSSRMSWETAKRAIDFFAQRTRDSLYVSIGFYGGEPLLEYDLIKKCIEYCNEVFKGKLLNYALTTNAFLLTPEKAKFLIDNHTSLLVSLDGPKEINDKNRKNAGDGGGTFDVVYSNLCKIQNELPDHYKKISFNSVVDPANDCSHLNNFFSCNMFKDSEIKTARLQPTVGKGAYYLAEYINSERNCKLLAMLSKIGIFDVEKLNTVAKNHLIQINLFEKQMRIYHELPDTMGHSGPCKPGVFKLFVTINGDLYPCERLKDNSDVMRIGSIFSSIDEEKAQYLYNVGYVCADRCVHCWNIRHCKICSTKINDGNSLSAEICSYECKYDCLDTYKKMLQIIA